MASSSPSDKVATTPVATTPVESNEARASGLGGRPSKSNGESKGGGGVSAKFLNWAILHTKVSDDAEKEAKKLASTLYISSKRAAFITGFAYKQLTSYGTAPNPDTLFLVFMCLSFIFGVIATSLSCFISYFLERFPDPEAKLRFIEGVANYVRLTFRFFIFAVFLYCLGLSRVGFVYFNVKYMRYVPFWIFLSTFFLLIFFIIYLVYVTNRRSPRGGLASEDGSNDNNNDNNNNNKGEDPDEFKALTERFWLFAERSIFIAGIAQYGISAATATSFLLNAAENQKNISFLYLFVITLSTALALAVSIILSSVGIFLNDAGPAIKSDTLNTYLLVFRLGHKMFYIALILQIIAIIIMPWGCSYDNDHLYINMFFGIMFLMLLSITLFWIYYNYLRVRNKSIPATGLDTISDKIAKDSTKSILSLLEKVGSQATIACSFSFRIIVGFRSIYHSNTQGRELISPNFYLITNLMVVLLGILVSVTDMAINYYVSKFRQSVQSQFLFLRYLRGALVSNYMFFYCSALIRFVVIALLGIIVFKNVSYIPAMYSIAGTLFVLAGYVFLDNETYWIETKSKEKAEKAEKAVEKKESSTAVAGENPPIAAVVTPAAATTTTATTTSLKESEGSQSVFFTNAKDELKQRGKAMRTQANQVLFLGTIALSTVSTNKPDKRLLKDLLFLNFLCASFIASLISIYFATLYETVSARQQGKNISDYIISTSPFYSFLACNTASVVLYLLLGFLVNGIYQHVFPVTGVCVIAFSAMAYISSFIRVHFNSADKIREVDPAVALKQLENSRCTCILGETFPHLYKSCVLRNNSSSRAMILPNNTSSGGDQETIPIEKMNEMNPNDKLKLLSELFESLSPDNLLESEEALFNQEQISSASVSGATNNGKQRPIFVSHNSEINFVLKENKNEKEGGTPSYKKMLNQIESTAWVSSFVGSSIYGEVMALQTIPTTVNNSMRNFYELLMTYAFCACLITVMISVLISYAFSALDRNSKRNHLYYKIKYLKMAVVVLAGTSFLAWILSAVFVPYIKKTAPSSSSSSHASSNNWTDPHGNAPGLPNTIIVSLGNALFIYFCVKLKLISNNSAVPTVNFSSSTDNDISGNNTTNTTNTSKNSYNTNTNGMPIEIEMQRTKKLSKE